MKFESETFFIGMIDFFSVVLPGAALTAFAHSRLEAGLFGEVSSMYESDAAGWAVFLFSSYVLGHFVFLLGAKLDDWLYDPIRRCTKSELEPRDLKLCSLLCKLREPPNNSPESYLLSKLSQDTKDWVRTRQPSDEVPEACLRALLKDLNCLIKQELLSDVESFKQVTLSWRTRRLLPRVTHPKESNRMKGPLGVETAGVDRFWLNRRILRDALPGQFKALPAAWRRYWAQLLFGEDADRAVDLAGTLKRRYVDGTADKPVINSFQWCKARLAMQAPVALGEVQRFEADSKFFRSLLVVLVVLFAFALLEACVPRWRWNYAGLALDLRQQQDPVSSYLWSRLSASVQTTLTNQPLRLTQAKESLSSAVETVLSGPSIYETGRFARVTLSSNTLALLSNSRGDLRRLNRSLLADAYPSELTRDPVVLPAVMYLVMIVGSGWRYMERRFKSTQQAYWYVITMETCPPSGKEKNDS